MSKYWIILNEHIFMTNNSNEFIGQISAILDNSIDTLIEIIINEGNKNVNYSSLNPHNKNRIFEYKDIWLLRPGEKVIDTHIEECVDIGIFTGKDRVDYLIPRTICNLFLKGYQEISPKCHFELFTPPKNDQIFVPPSFTI